MINKHLPLVFRSNDKNKYVSSQQATEMTGVKTPSKPEAEGALNKLLRKITNIR